MTLSVGNPLKLIADSLTKALRLMLFGSTNANSVPGVLSRTRIITDALYETCFLSRGFSHTNTAELGNRLDKVSEP